MLAITVWKTLITVWKTLITVWMVVTRFSVVCISLPFKRLSHARLLNVQLVSVYRVADGYTVLANGQHKKKLARKRRIQPRCCISSNLSIQRSPFGTTLAQLCIPYHASHKKKLARKRHYRYNSAPAADELLPLHLVFYDHYNMLDDG